MKQNQRLQRWEALNRLTIKLRNVILIYSAWCFMLTVPWYLITECEWPSDWSSTCWRTCRHFSFWSEGKSSNQRRSSRWQHETLQTFTVWYLQFLWGTEPGPGPQDASPCLLEITFIFHIFALLNTFEGNCVFCFPAHLKLLQRNILLILVSGVSALSICCSSNWSQKRIDDFFCQLNSNLLTVPNQPAAVNQEVQEVQEVSWPTGLEDRWGSGGPDRNSL